MSELRLKSFEDNTQVKSLCMQLEPKFQTLLSLTQTHKHTGGSDEIPLRCIGFCKKLSLCNTCLPLHNFLCPKLASEKQTKSQSGGEQFSLETVKITDIIMSITLIAVSRE